MCERTFAKNIKSELHHFSEEKLPGHLPLNIFDLRENIFTRQSKTLNSGIFSLIQKIIKLTHRKRRKLSVRNRRTFLNFGLSNSLVWPYLLPFHMNFRLYFSNFFINRKCSSVVDRSVDKFIFFGTLDPTYWPPCPVLSLL